MSPVERQKIHALTKFAPAGLAYNCNAAYVAQLFTYLMFWGRFGGFPQAQDIQSNPKMQSAFAAVDRLAASVPADACARGVVVLALRKEELRQLLTVLGKASEAQDQSEILQDAIPQEFPYSLPDIEFTPDYYGDAFEVFLTAVDEDRSAQFLRPAFWKLLRRRLCRRGSEAKRNSAGGVPAARTPHWGHVLAPSHAKFRATRRGAEKRENPDSPLWATPVRFIFEGPGLRPEDSTLKGGSTCSIALKGGLMWADRHLGSFTAPSRGRCRSSGRERRGRRR
jgi:hypothetical protein